jgi:hypothetical protein
MSKLTIVAIVGAVGLALYLFLTRNASTGATSLGTSVAGGVPSLLNQAPSNPANWIAGLESALGIGGVAATSAIDASGGVITGGASAVQLNAAQGGFVTTTTPAPTNQSQVNSLEGILESNASSNLAATGTATGLDTTSSFSAGTLTDPDSSPSYDNSLIFMSPFAGVNSSDLAALAG